MKEPSTTDPALSPRAAVALLVAVLLVALGSLFGRTLSPDYFVFGTDTVSHDYPCLRWAWDETLSTGRIPLWCPYLFCGIPTLGTLLFCPFYPTQWLFAALPFPLAFTLQYVLAFFWAGMGAYALARRMGCEPAAAVVAGVAFGLSGHVTTLAYAGHTQKVLAIAWLPWALAGWAAMAEGRRGGAILAGVAVGMQLLASHPQIAYYTVATGFVLMVCMIGWKDRLEFRFDATEPVHRERWGGRQAKGVLLFLLSLVFATALAGGQLGPVLEMNPLSNRAAGVSYEEATKTSFPPWELPEILLPCFSGDSIRGGYGHYTGGWGEERIVSDYAGASVLVLAIVGLFAGRKRRRWFWAALWLAAAAMAMGKYSPLYWLAFHVVPGVAKFRSPGTIMVLMALSTAMLAGWGTEVMLKPRDRASSPLKRPFPPLVLVALAFLVLYASHRQAGRLIFHDPSSGVTSFSSARVTGSHAALQASFHAIVFALAFGLVLACARGPLRGRPISGLLVLTFVIVTDLFGANGVFVQPEPARRIEAWLQMAPPDPLLADRTPPARILEIGNELTNRRIFNRITSLHGYHPITFGRYHELIESLGGFADARTLEAFDANYLLGPAPSPREDWPPQGFDLSDSPPFSDPQRNELLYRAKRAWGPLLSLDKSKSQNDFGARWIAYEPDRLAFELAGTRAERGSVVLRDPYMAGWEARADGKVVAVAPDRKYQFFRSVTVRGDAKKVEMVYRPFSFRVGMFATLTAWAFLVCWVVGACRSPLLGAIQTSGSSLERLCGKPTMN